MSNSKIVVVSDPMCSWCWGMAEDIRTAVDKLSDTVDFDLMLGGINVHGTQPIGDYGRRFLMRLWREVQDTTGQNFGFRLPDSYIHNSVVSCVAIELLRPKLTADELFDALHQLQSAFFEHGEDITDPDVIVDRLAMFDLQHRDIEQGLGEPRIKAQLQFQFDSAGSYGTNALPSLLIQQGASTNLLAGGYVDGDMIEELILHRLN